MTRVIRWTTFVLTTAFAMVACADLPSEPTASKINPAAPQFDLVNMPPGRVPFVDYHDFVDIVDENGHTIWQDVLQPAAGASFTLVRAVPAPIQPEACGWQRGFFCRPIGTFEFVGDLQEDCSNDDGYYLGEQHDVTIAMYHWDFQCENVILTGYVMQAGEQWTVTAAANAPGGRYFQRTEISMVGLNGDPARQVLPCEQGLGSLTCRVTLPEDVTQNIHHPQFRVFYGLAYPFGGFLSPVDAPPTVNVAKAGSAVPVKFSLGSDLGLAIMAAGSPSSVQVACSASSTVDAVEETSASSTSGLHYNASSNQYTYVWKTEKSWAGTCRELRLAFTDNAPAKTAIFQFSK